jgi:prepilin-type N-terminal cleavage/methylation domain-containing protein
MKKTLNRGFTLIELLVVIAIIGILASVVLASLNSARAKGSDAAIKSTVNNARAQAELYYDSISPAGYTTVCTAGTNNIAPLVTAVEVTNGAGTGAFCSNSQSTWMLKSILVSDPTHYYCVDSTGKAQTYTSGWAASGTACP